MNFIVFSLQYLSSGITAILITLGPAVTVLLAHFFLPEEPLTRRKSIGVGLALSGAVLLALLGESGLSDVSAANPIGYILVLTAIAVSSTMTIYARKYMSDLDPMDVATARITTAALVVMPLSALFVGFDLSHVDQAGYVALGWAALAGTFLGILLAFYNIKRFGATAAAMTAYVIPVVASVGGIFLLDEQITAGMLGGMALVVIGIAVINQRVKQPVELTKAV